MAGFDLMMDEFMSRGMFDLTWKSAAATATATATTTENVHNFMQPKGIHGCTINMHIVCI